MNEVSRSAKRLRARLLAGAAALGLLTLASPVLAQEAAPTADGLQPAAFYLEANEVVTNDKDQVVTARGDVEVRYQGRTLRAQEIIYDRKTGVVSAKGQTAIVNPDGSAQFAEAITLDDEMRAGVAEGFSTRLGGDVKIAAASAVRRSETISELNKAIYTPCPICVDEDGESHGPTWSIRAEKVVQDRAKHIVYYRNAVITMFGVPVFYAPVFWHADPSAPRQSGLLAPKIAASRRRGLSYEQPYLHVISPSQDVVISPQLNTKVNPFLNTAWRKRFETGQVNARAGYTYEAELDGEGHKLGNETNRSYLLADGVFDINPFWRWGFAAERTSDDLIFDKYEISDVYGQRGLVGTEDRRLTSQLYTTRQDQRSYLSIAAISIQGLRPTDIDRTFPTIAPLIEARFEPTAPVLGGRLRLLGSGVALTREQSAEIGSVRGDPGIDSRRATAEADWRSNYTLSNGLRLSPFANVRGDLYSIDDLPGDEEKTEGRLLGVAGLDIRWPFFRRDGNRTIVLEPVAQLAISPDSDPIVIGEDADGLIYFNEDSLGLEFDETNLFRANKFPGFDLYEGGIRLNAGGRVTVAYDSGRSASLLVGRSFRADTDFSIPSRSGLQTRASDWIVAAEAAPMAGVSLFSRARFEAESGSLRRIEAGADVNLDRGRGFVRYLRDNEDVLGEQREDIDFAGDLLLAGNWGITVRGVRDLERDVWRRQEIGALYRDDCLDLRIVWVHEETFNRTLGPSDSVQVRLTLATLGDKGYRQ
jgi:LPS-assembly protein